MIIEGNYRNPIELSSFDDVDGMIWQDDSHCVIIDKQQAAQLIEVLQKWLDGKEIE